MDVSVTHTPTHLTHTTHVHTTHVHAQVTYSYAHGTGLRLETHVRAHTDIHTDRQTVGQAGERGGTADVEALADVEAPADAGLGAATGRRVAAAKHTKAAVRHMPAIRRRFLTLAGLRLPKTRTAQPPTPVRAHTHASAARVASRGTVPNGGRTLQSARGADPWPAVGLPQAFSPPPARLEERAIGSIGRDVVPIVFAEQQQTLQGRWKSDCVGWDACKAAGICRLRGAHRCAPRCERFGRFGIPDVKSPGGVEVVRFRHLQPTAPPSLGRNPASFSDMRPHDGKSPTGMRERQPAKPAKKRGIGVPRSC